MLLSQQQPRWQESTLDNHDISIPLPNLNLNREKSEQFRFILLSAQELTTLENAIERIERLYHLHGGRHVGLVFLLSPNHAGTAAFMNLQIDLQSKLEMPILPLSNLASLPATLAAFQRQLVESTRSASSISHVNPMIALLPYCSIDPPIPEHARNIVTDICANIVALGQAATTSDGSQTLREYLSGLMSATGEGSVAEDLIAFWEQEFIVD